MITCAASAQVSGAKNVVFFGLDFSEFRLIHKNGFLNKNGTPLCKSLTFKYFTEWNEMFKLEPKKYSIIKYFNVPKYEIELQTSLDRNQQYKSENCIIEDDSYTIDKEKIKSIVVNYNSTRADLGLIIVVESMDKQDEICKFYSVFFNLKTHEIVSLEKGDGPPGGEGIRNYWIHAIHVGLERNSNKYK